MFIDTLFQAKHRIATLLRDTVDKLPRLRHKPRLLLYWLQSAYRAHLLLVLLLLIVPFVVLPLFDWLLEQIFTPVTREVLFGLIEKQREHPYLVPAKLTVRWLAWGTALFVAIYFYLRHLPESLVEAHAIAERKRLDGERLLERDPQQTLLLFNEARAWSFDPEQESLLEQRIDDVDRQLQGKTQIAATVVGGAMDATLVSAPLSVQPELIGDRYRTLEQLGRGAMGIVYLAEDSRLHRQVALKQLSPHLSADAQLLARFRQEALALARLSHPHIVQVYDFIEWNDLSFIAMELVRGSELNDRLQAEGPLPVGEVLELADQMADALGYAHQKGVIHRDFKPANVLISEEGKVKVTDFGIAKLAQSSLHTQLDTVMGSPAYMSPEQANGEGTDARTDIYALGIILYQMVSGELPFQGDIKAIITQQLTRAPMPLDERSPDVDPVLAGLVMAMLQKSPAERPQSMAEVRQRLAPLRKP